MTNCVTRRVPNRGTCRILRDEKGGRGRIRSQKHGGVRVETGAEEKKFSGPGGMRLVAKDASETPYVCVSRPLLLFSLTRPTRRSGIDMTQNDSPNPTDIGGEILAPENVNALVHVGPKPDVTNGPRQERQAEAASPDPFAVGVRVLRMAPAWLLSVTAGCSMLILLLGWMNPGGMASTVAYAPALNDARPAQVLPAVPATPAAQPVAPAQPAQATVPAAVTVEAAPAPESATAAAPAQETAPAPAAEQAAHAPEAPAKEQAPAATSQAEVKEKAETPAKSSDAGGNFTVQVGSFNNSSEANERVSSLRNAGFESRAVAVELPGRGTWYRVQVGRFADRAEASKAASSLRAKGAAAAIVVPVQN